MCIRDSLDDLALSRGCLQDLPELRKRRTGGLIEMDMETGIDAGRGMFERVANPGLNRNGLQAGQVQQLLAAYPAQTLVDPEDRNLSVRGLSGSQTPTTSYSLLWR